MQTAPNIHALVQLLDDPDELIFDQIKAEILNLGSAALPTLAQLGDEDNHGLLFHERVELIMRTIQNHSLSDELVSWKNENRGEILEALLILSRFKYPDLDETLVRADINKLKQDVWLEINDDLTAFEKVKILNHFFFEEFGFTGDTSTYHSPQNSFIVDVLKNRQGNPISLSLIYMIIAKGLKLPVYGVNLPRHFILALANNQFTQREPQELGEILCYINPFNNGTLFMEGEIDQFLEQLNLPKKPNYYLPCDNVSIINRILNNLIFSYTKENNALKANQLREIQDKINE